MSTNIPVSRSFQAAQDCSRHFLASSDLCWDIRTEARAWRASELLGSVWRARLRRSSHVFSASGSKLGRYVKARSYGESEDSTYHRSY